MLTTAIIYKRLWILSLTYANNSNMNKADESDIKSFYNSSDLYFNICQNRDQSSFTNIIDVINQYSPKKSLLLEFGCGTGNLANFVGRNERQVIGVDISEKFVKYAQETYAENPNLKFQVVSFGTLPFNDFCSMVEATNAFHSLSPPGKEGAISVFVNTGSTCVFTWA